MARPPRADPPSPIVRLLSALGLGLLVSIVVLLALRHPSELSFAPVCPWRALTGLRCAGCGLTRATHHLLQGRLGAALELNPLIVVVPFLFIGLGVFLAIGVARGRLPRLRELPLWVGWALFVGLAGFWGARTVIDLWPRG